MRHGRCRFFPTVLIPKSDGVKPMIRTLKAGMPAYYLPDQDHGRTNAVFAPFFGVPAATLSTLPRLAKITQAQIVPVITRQRSWGRGYAVRFYPPWVDFPGSDLDADVARMNRFIEDRVRETPAEYLWLHRRFKTRPEGEAAVYD
jgi:KDO2-lipid IV(A) lauroyltransferase